MRHLEELIWTIQGCAIIAKRIMMLIIPINIYNNKNQFFLYLKSIFFHMQYTNIFWLYRYIKNNEIYITRSRNRNT